MFKYSAEITRVVDGDTVDCIIDLGFKVFTKQRVRLFGINTPESRTRDKEEKKRGKAATARLIAILFAHANKITLESHEFGKYGRCLGVLWVEGDEEPVNVNQMLVEEGHAVEYFGGKR
jgi:micrococcal nuclease